MNLNDYVNKFQQVADGLNASLLNKKQIEVATGIVLNSAFLKLYKRTWVSSLQDSLHAESRIFFSVWVNEATVKEQKVFYNIHALKLRKLKGYTIQSRKFAEVFRHDFKKFEKDWENVSTAFGPLTLMEGWIELDPVNLQKDILKLTNNFLKIEYLVDMNLDRFKNIS